MYETLLVVLVVLVGIACFFIKRCSDFLERCSKSLFKVSESFDFVNKHYFAFNRSLIERTFEDVKKVDTEESDIRYALYEEGKGKTVNKESKKLFQSLEEARIKRGRLLDEYRFLIEANLALLNGKKSIQHLSEEYEKRFGAFAKMKFIVDDIKKVRSFMDQFN